MPVTALAREILDFWFGPPPLGTRNEWFRKDAAFDATIRDRFGDAIAAACAGAYGEWCDEPHGSLARVLLLDQFTRNAYRDLPAAFSGDARALATAQDAVAKGFDRRLDPIERHFVYMPFMHSEDAKMQQRSLALFAALSQERGDRSPLEWAERHAAIVQRFGRYPHRNAILDRPSTAEEIEFLKSPGASF